MKLSPSTERQNSFGARFSDTYENQIEQCKPYNFFVWRATRYIMIGCLNLVIIIITIIKCLLGALKDKGLSHRPLVSGAARVHSRRVLNVFAKTTRPRRRLGTSDIAGQ